MFRENIMRLPNFLISLIALFYFNFSFAANVGNKSFEVNVMTFNLRVPVDPIPFDWNTRRPLVVQYIKSQRPDFFGIQEAVPSVVKDLASDFPDYAFVGRGRDKDGTGEGTQIFYKSDRWSLDANDNGTLQLSPTPEVVGSNGWNMQFTRIFTWAHFIEKKSGKAIYVFNTHFPLVPKERRMSSTLLARTIANRKHSLDPIILSGDFNACEAEESIQYLLGANASPINLMDSYRDLHFDDKTGTFHDFGKQNESCKVDYIFVSRGITPIASEIIKDDPKIGFASDHYAVVAKVKITNSH